MYVNEICTSSYVEETKCVMFQKGGKSLGEASFFAFPA